MAKASSKSTRIRAGGGKRHGIEGGSPAAPLVDTVTVKGAGAPFAITTVGGTWHVAPSGVPLQASDTVPVKPAPGVNCNWYWAVCPADTEAVVEPFGAGPGVKAGLAVALREIVWGEPGASSAMVRLAVRWPAASGLKPRETVQLIVGATGAVQLLARLKSEGLRPPRTKDEMWRDVVPEFKTVSVCAPPEVP